MSQHPSNVEDLRVAALNVLEECRLLLARPQQMDVVVSRLESLLEAILVIGQQNTIPWEPSVTNHIQAAVQLLEQLIEQPESHSTGRPKIYVPFRTLEALIGMKFSVPAVARILGTSRQTVFRRMSEFGLSIRATYSPISDDELDRVIQDILLEHPNTGYKRMKGFLQHRDIRVTDVRVRMSIRNVDPLGVYQRTMQNRAIIRRQYFVEYSNQMWHLDTNMKLIRWNIIVRSCIDGKSRTVIYLDASADNRADTNLASFLVGVGRYGVPLRVRSDKGGENVLIARYMIETRGSCRASHIAGRSVHNQRIERFWRDVFVGLLGFYYSVFSKLEDDGILDIGNEAHVYLLHRIFLPRLNYHLNEFMEGWNLHPVSSEHNHSPRQLMLMHLPPPEFDLPPSQEDLTSLDFACNNEDDLTRFDNQDSITNPIAAYNRTLEIDAFMQIINPLQPSENFGYDVFKNAIESIFNN